MSIRPHDVIVLGAGPAGYVCAIRAAQLGLKAAVVEREALGGVCLNVGCIPSKALLRNAEVIRLLTQGGRAFGFETGAIKTDYSVAVKRSRQVSARLVKGVELLLKQNNVDVLTGAATLADRNLVQVESSSGTTRLPARNIVLATGARASFPPGLIPDGSRILTYREAILQTSLPASVVIVGAGPIGLEFATIWSAYGVPVTLVELLPRIAPLEDEEVSAELAKELTKRGIEIRTGTRVQEARVDGDQVRLVLDQDGSRTEVSVGQVLLATGFRPNSENLGLESLGVALDRGRVVIDSQYATTVPGIRAVGDVTGKLMLAHVGSAMGYRCAELIAGRNPPPLEYEFIARGIYSQPQAAAFGLTEAQARAKGLSFRTAKFPFQANGKALGLGDYAGWAKLIAEEGTGRLLGAHLVGPEVTELLPELTLAQAHGLTANDLVHNVHAHPTLGEALAEAAHGLTGTYLHL